MNFVEGRLFDFIILMGIWVLGLYMIYKKKDLWIRRHPAVDFIEEAINRAAEMGKPVVTSGYGGINEGMEGKVASMIMAGLAVLGHVARICARTDTRLYALQRNVTAMPVCDEVIKTSYTLENKLDVYYANREDMLPWVVSPPSIVALADRLRPGANIMIGCYFAEAVQIAEAYNKVGAISIGGASLSQTPFLVAICDMALIGEEMYAVSTYLNTTDKMLGSVATGDTFKVIAISLIIFGTILATLGRGYVEPLLNMLNM